MWRDSLTRYFLSGLDYFVEEPTYFFWCYPLHKRLGHGSAEITLTHECHSGTLGDPLFIAHRLKFEGSHQIVTIGDVLLRKPFLVDLPEVIHSLARHDRDIILGPDVLGVDEGALGDKDCGGF